mgnify:FL=1
MEKIKVLDVLLWMSILIAIVMVFWFIFGNSPTVEQVVVGMLLPAYFYIFKTKEFVYQTREQLTKKINETAKNAV